MRPPGETRMAVMGAMACGGVTLRDIVQSTGVDYEAARTTIKYAVRSGAVAKVGERRDAHCRRPVTVYAPGDGNAPRTELAAAVRSFWESPASGDAFPGNDPVTTTID